MYQWLRACSLIVSDGQDGLDLSSLHLRFTVYHRTIQSPSSMSARVYNLEPSTMQRIFKEFTQVVLKAGYRNEDGEIFDTIFKGYIIQSRIGRENPTDTFIDIMAADGDLGYNYATMIKSLSAGHTNQDIKREINTSFSVQNVATGYEANMPEIKYPRGRVLFGMTRDYARDLAYSTGHTWSIKHGTYETVEQHGVLPDGIIELPSQTGLIGLPQQTPDGVTARALLNPYIIHNRQVKLNNKSIQGLAFPVPATSEGTVAFYYDSQVGISPDGIYRVIAVDHIGDNRGQAWYSDMWLMGKGATLPRGGNFYNMDIGPWGPEQREPTVQPAGSAPAVKQEKPPDPKQPATPGR